MIIPPICFRTHRAFRTTGYSGSNPTNWYNGETYSNLTWEQGRRLSSLTMGTTSISYDYDMSGIRSSKIVGDTRYEYVTQSGKVVREKATKVSTGEFVHCMDFFYDTSGRPFTIRKYSNENLSGYYLYYFILNAQGDVVGLLDAYGDVKAKYSYDAWGKLLSVTDANGTAITSSTHIANINPLRYRGYFWDSDTGWYYLQSRYYDPIVKRFLNSDVFASTGQGFLGCNMFAYCGNNPQSNCDETGELFDFIDGIANAAICFICSISTGDSLEEAIIDASVGFAVGFIGGQFGRIVGSVYAGFTTWLNGGNLWDILASMGLSYLASYVTGDILLGDSAQDLEKLLVTLPFGTGANLVSELLCMILSFVTTDNQANLQDSKPIPYCSNAPAGGGGGLWNYETVT